MKKNTIISDLDGTLYPKSNGLTKQIDQLAESFLISETGMSKGELAKLEELFPNILDALKALQISEQKYYDNVHNKLDYSVLNPNTEMTKLLTSLNLKVFVVSLSPAEHINKVLSLLQIDHLIDCTFSVAKEKSSNKGDCYKNIMQKYKLPVDEVCVVGDNYLLDIEPAQRLNISTALISSTKLSNTESFVNFVDFLKYIKEN